MTAEAQADRVAAQASIPSWTLDGRQLGDLELILSGAFAPLRGFMTAADVESVEMARTLADGTPWPIAVTLELPADAIAADASQLVLADPEGTPLAVLTITERSAVLDRGAIQSETTGLIRLAGPVTANRVPEHGSFRRLMISPEQARAQLGDGPVLGFATRAPLGGRQIGQLRHLAEQLRARLLVLPLVAGTAEVVRQPEALIRAVLAATASLPQGTLVVPVPLAPREDGADRPGAGTGAGRSGAGTGTGRSGAGTGAGRSGAGTGAGRSGAGTGAGRSGAGTGAALPGTANADVSSARELAAAAIVAAAYGATHLIAEDWPHGGSTIGSDAGQARGLPGALIPVLASGDWAFDPGAEVWRPLALIEPGTELEDLSADQLADMLDTGAPLPSWFAPEAVVAELRHARPPRSERGFVVFLTGLSGSGKSTIARDLRDLLAERGDRRVSLLDGDLVRTLLSAGLTFSRADRDLNIARIGYVAAEIARHGGIAICAPIAPYAAARDRVRKMVSEVGDFLLIHVATPVEVCEERDRKGLYAKARAGLIGQFTGISDPYEEPTDAVAVIDTSMLSREQACETIMELLTSGGWLSSS